jgi:5'-deoxynucleotidase YfbR-like HD superfamily hydrolase
VIDATSAMASAMVHDVLELATRDVPAPAA